MLDKEGHRYITDTRVNGDAEKMLGWIYFKYGLSYRIIGVKVLVRGC